jgi:hypothetical protein
MSNPTSDRKNSNALFRHFSVSKIRINLNACLNVCSRTEKSDVYKQEGTKPVSLPQFVSIVRAGNTIFTF